MLSLLAALSLLQADPPTQIHLAYGVDPSRDVVVMWRTALPTAASEVRYGTTPALGSSAAGASVAAGTGRVHTVSLAGLEPGTTYQYSCGDPTAGWSALESFRTAPASGGRTVFAAYGDAGVSAEAASVVARTAAMDPDFVLLLGDLSYANGGSSTIWDSWFDQLQPSAARAPHQPVLGNHELVGGDLAVYQTRFAATVSRRWYSFDAGCVHFSMVDSNSPVDPASAQYAWLEADLASASGWRIVCFHHAAYSSATIHGSNAAMKALGPLLEAHGVALVLTGHVHNYERTEPTAFDGAVTAGAPVYVCAGTGGRPYYTFTAVKPAWSAVRAMFHGAMRIVAEPGRLDVQAVAADGSVMDGFAIAKPAAPTFTRHPANPDSDSSRCGLLGVEVPVLLAAIRRLRRRS